MERRYALSQTSDTSVRERSSSTCPYRYGYFRSSECREAGEPGQDYLTIAERDNSLSFVLCDGISQSYYGEFAAKFVGDRLLDWLSSVEAHPADPMLEWQRELDRYMRELTVEAGVRLQDHLVPPDIQGWLRDVLTEKKKRGSATMYCGGRIDFPGKPYPDGRLLLAWQGDIRCRIWRDREERTEELFGDRFHTRHQWNSVAGPVGGMPNLFCSSLLQGGNTGELLVYSDGFQALDRFPFLSDLPLAELMANEASRPSSDDICFYQVNWNFTSA
ncbi:hypothetical protein ACF3MZ_07230 [Paenibacillaceae bacterium WGS1546]|uniref:hypothetical protein n=1 Tax=Cohnella sp. WGS1546 TaxID=3366810 RepID=UPI00372D0EEB